MRLRGWIRSDHEMWPERLQPIALKPPCEWEADVAVLDDAGRGGEGEAAGEEDGFGVADAEGGEAVDPGEEVGGEVGGVSFGVVGELGDEERRR